MLSLLRFAKVIRDFRLWCLFECIGIKIYEYHGTVWETLMVNLTCHRWSKCDSYCLKICNWSRAAYQSDRLLGLEWCQFQYPSQSQSWPDFPDNPGSSRTCQPSPGLCLWPGGRVRGHSQPLQLCLLCQPDPDGEYSTVEIVVVEVMGKIFMRRNKCTRMFSLFWYL